ERDEETECPSRTEARTQRRRAVNSLYLHSGVFHPHPLFHRPCLLTDNVLCGLAVQARSHLSSWRTWHSSAAWRLAYSLHDRSVGVGAERAAEGVAHLAERAVGPDAVEEGVHQVAAGRRGLRQRPERSLRPLLVALAADAVEALEVALEPLGVDVEDRDVERLVDDVVVHADDDTLAAVHLLLEAPGAVGNLPLDEARLDRRGHA